MGLKCRICGGDLHPEEGSAMCKCELCGTVQPVPAAAEEEQAAPEQLETAYFEAEALEHSAGTAADLLAAADAYDRAGDYRDAKEKASSCRTRAEAEKETEKAASLQKWLHEREKREKEKQEEERELAEKERERRNAEMQREKAGRKIRTYSAARQDAPPPAAAPVRAETPEPSPVFPAEKKQAENRRIRTFSRKDAAGEGTESQAQVQPGTEGTAGRKEEQRPVGIRRKPRADETRNKQKQQEDKKKKIIIIAAVAAVAVLAAGGYLLAGKLFGKEDNNTRAQAPVSSVRPEGTDTAAATPAPEEEQNREAENYYRQAEEYLANQELAKAKEYYQLASGYSDAAKKLDNIIAYELAEEENRDGSLISARGKYAALGGFLDAEARYEEVSAALYAQAVKALEEKDYGQAGELLAALGDYADCASLTARVDRDYQTALSHWKSGEKRQAEQELEAIAGWKDTGVKLTALRTEIAEDAVANEDYETALTYYGKLPYSEETGSRMAAAKQAKDYRDGLTALESGNLDEARRMFISAGGYQDADRQIADLEKYRQAKDALDAEKYEEARLLFSELGDYLDAADSLAACDSAIQQKTAETDNRGGGDSGGEDLDTAKETAFSTALSHLENGETAEAEEILAGLAGWKAADEKLEQLREEIADQAAEAGDYETAIAYYNKLTNRTDAIIAKLIAANKGKNYQEAMAALASGNTDTAYAKLIAADDYRDAADQLSKLSAYRRAGTAMAGGRYREARADYIGLGTYLDSAENLETCNAALYREATERKSNGDTAGAYELFSLISGYLDSGDIAAGMDADYQAALDHIENGERPEAEALLAGLTGWKDADEKLEQVREEIADQAAETGDYETAAAYYGLLKNRTDEIIEKQITAVKGKSYQEAMAALAAGDPETAAAKLIAADGFRDAAEQLDKLNTYRSANAAMAEGRYREARADYIGLGAYIDSAENLETCNAALYREAAELKAGGDNAGAYELFTLLSGYSDSGNITAGMDADYQAALDHIVNGEKYEAERLLTGLTGWKDTDGMLEKVREGIADDAAEAGDFDTAIAYYSKLNSRTEAIEEKLSEAVRGKNYREAAAAMAAGELETAYAGFTAAGGYRDAAEQVIKLDDYRKAEALKTSGAFDEAAAVYAGLGNYLDSAEQVNVCLYGKAEAQLAGGDADGAAETFRSIPEYRDSAERADAIHYEKAKALWDNGDLTAARAEYENLGGYADAPELMQKVLDEITDGYIAAKEYGTALDVYLALEQTEAVKEKEYNFAQRCYDEGYYAEATTAYEALGQYALSLSKLPVARYAWADELFNAGEYEKAAEQFTLLGDMSDSAARASESVYRLALSLLEDGRYDEGKERFASIAGYSDADAQAKECDYRKAVSMADAGNMREAQALFESLGDYSDSRTKADMCIYAQAEELFAAEQYEEAKDLYGSVKYLDSAEKYGRCVYILADALFEEGRYAEAKDMFSSVDYLDSRDKASESAYREAEGHYSGKQYAEAERCFLALGRYRDSEDRAKEAHLLQGSALMEAGDYEGALAFFETVEYGDSGSLAAKCHYELGYAAHAAGKPDDAVKQYAHALAVPEAEAAIMSAAKDYATVKEMGKAIQTLWLIRDQDEAKNYLTEIAALERQAGEPLSALLAYTSAGDTGIPELRELLAEVTPEAFMEYVQTCTLLPDEKEYANDNVYMYAEALFSAGMYDEAAAAYEAAGEYADAAGKVTEARYQYAKSLYDAGDYTAAYAAYKRVKGYADTDELLAADRHLIEAKQAPYVTAGNIVTFGSYEQDNDLSNGPEKIEWIVLEARNGKSLLLSRYGLDAQPYNTRNASITWERSTLRAWLNGEFLQTAFTAEEQAAISTSTLSNSLSQGYWRTSGGKDTQDQVFLLSYAEANKYLGVTYKDSRNEKARTSPTAYAAAHGAESSSTILTDEGQGVGIWWLRSPGLNEQSAAHVHNGGSLYYRGVSSLSLMVRPAIVLDLSSDIF